MRLVKGRLALVVVATAALAIMSVPGAALAQSAALSVTIPFDFHVGAKTLPSGTYIVDRLGEAIRISDSNGHTAVIISTTVSNPAAKLDSQLVFNRYGADCYLSEVRWNGYLSGRGLMKSTTEVELAKAFSGRSVLAAGLAK